MICYQKVDTSVSFSDYVPGIKLDASIGMPMPRLAYIPSSNSTAARRTIFSLILAAAEGAFASPEQISINVIANLEVLNLI